MENKKLYSIQKKMIGTEFGNEMGFRIFAK